MGQEPALAPVPWHGPLGPLLTLRGVLLPILELVPALAGTYWPMGLSHEPIRGIGVTRPSEGGARKAKPGRPPPWVEQPRSSGLLSPRTPTRCPERTSRHSSRGVVVESSPADPRVHPRCRAAVLVPLDREGCREVDRSSTAAGLPGSSTQNRAAAPFGMDLDDDGPAGGMSGLELFETRLTLGGV